MNTCLVYQGFSPHVHNLMKIQVGCSVIVASTVGWLMILSFKLCLIELTDVPLVDINCVH